MVVSIQDIQITKLNAISYKFNLSPKYIHKGRLFLDKLYEVACFSEGHGVVQLKNRKIHQRAIKRKGRMYTEYWITVPKSLVDHKMLLLKVDYTLELF